MLVEIDQNTLANMTAALEYVCNRIPADRDSHELRKQIGDAMITAAKNGKRSFVDLQDTGLNALKEILSPSKPGWLTRLFR
jgi:hypothetical protein